MTILRTHPHRALLAAVAGIGALAVSGGVVEAQAASSSASGDGVVIIETDLGYQGAKAAGTGMVLTPSGEVLTNNHVINGATSVKVIIPSSGQSFQAHVVGYSATRDVAVIQLTGASNLHTAAIGDSSSVSVGQAVTALGNAGGTGSLTPAAGTITGLNRTITAGDEGGGDSEQLSGMIETDANVQPGDSGGPLLDASGHIIGMDTAASAGNSLASGYGAPTQADAYAIPINDALTLANQIESGHGSAEVHVGGTAFLGVQVAPAQDASSGYGSPYGGGSGYSSPYGDGSGYSSPYGDGSGYGGYGSSDPYGYGSSAPSTQSSGATIAGVVQGGPADQAGIAQGDTITAVDGQAIDSADALPAALQSKQPGQSVSLTVVDQSGNAQTVNVTLGSGPAK